MKKSKFMRVAAILMAAVLLTTCAISGTFAKYTSTSSGTDSARVAKWGFDTVNLDISGLFSDVYATDDSTTFSGTNSVASNGTGTITDVIAPGTSGSTTFAFAPEAVPEVAYTFTVAATGTCDPTIVANTNITWGLDSTTGLTFAQLLAAINALSGDASGSKVYAPNTAPTGFAVGSSHTISWNWAFETATGEGQPAAQDAVDTGLGNADTLATTTITIAVTATQVD